MSTLAQDLRHTLRSLRRAPGFTLVAVVTLALGIGGTTAIFSVVDGVMLRALPYPQPHRLVAFMRTVNGEEPRGNSLSPADYLDFERDAAAVFTAVAAYREDIVDLTGMGEPERLSAVQATGGYFDVFGAAPLAGRVFHAATDPPDGPRVAVISEGLWRRRFAAAPDAVGSTIRLNGEPTTVLGVMPAWFGHPRDMDVWVLSPQRVPTSPVPITGDLLAERGFQYFSAVARLTPGTGLAAAASQIAAVGDRLAREFPDDNGNESFTLVSLHESLVGNVRTAMLVLLAAIAGVLLIACANVASLLLARGAGRRRELAVRTALGATRARIVHELLTESLVLAVLGGTLGLLLSVWLVDMLVALAPASIPRLADVGFDWRVALFATCCTGLVGIAFGLAPAVSAASDGRGVSLRDGGRSATTGRTRARNTLVVAEVAVALVLLIGAGLLLSSFFRLLAVEPGFRTARLTAVQAPLPTSRYDAQGQRRFYRTLTERLQANPVTARSALVFPFPLRNNSASGGYRVVGRDYPGGKEPVAELYAVSPGYFATVGIPLVQGRDFTAADAEESTPVVVINKTLAEREWPGQNPVGQHIIAGGRDNERLVVGVVGNARQRSLQAPPGPAFYLPYPQFTLPFLGVVVESDAGTGAVTAGVRDAVHAVDSGLPIGRSFSIEDLLRASTGEPRFRAVLIAVFAAVALALAVVGIYGLISYTVAERIREIGVRVALGATPGQVQRLVIGGGLKLAGAGVLVGLALAAALLRVLQGLLYGVSATDPLVYAGLSLLLLAVAVLACWFPARRAMRVDPLRAIAN